MDICGVLNLNKPSGRTSRDVVNAVQRLAGRKTKVGHAGTLDPLARGVLVVPVGPATRLIEYVQQMSKTYRAEFLLGHVSETEDTDGEVHSLESPRVPSEAEVLSSLPRLTGKILQRPPAYSAVKVQGKRAYDLAREGKDVELAAREVVVHRVSLEAYEYPSLRLTIECGSGTYVRSLGRDLAESLGTGAVMSELERTAIGPFRVEDAVDPDSLTEAALPEVLLPATTAVCHLTKLTLDADAARRIQNGQMIARPKGIDPAADLTAVDEDGRLIGILMGKGRGKLKAKRNFPTQ